MNNNEISFNVDEDEIVTYCDPEGGVIELGTMYDDQAQPMDGLCISVSATQGTVFIPTDKLVAVLRNLSEIENLPQVIRNIFDV